MTLLPVWTVLVLFALLSADGQRSNLAAFRWRSGYSLPWRYGVCTNDLDVGCRASVMESPRVLLDLKDLPNVCALQQVSTTNKKYYSHVLSYRPRRMCGKPAYVRYHCCSGFESVLGVKGCMAELPVVDIAATAKKNHLSKFLAAAEVTDMMSTFQEQGTYTVFIPENAAFRRTTISVREMMTQSDGNTLIKYHMINGRRNSSQLHNGALLPTFYDVGNGVEKLRVAKYANGIVTVNCARITIPNLLATNGMVHVVDKVIEPIYDGTIMDFIENDERFQDLVVALIDTGVADELRKPKLKTLFAPTAEAFQNVSSDVLSRFLLDSDILRDVLLYHIIPHDICAGAIFTSCGIKTLEGSRLNTSCDVLDRLVINDAIVIQSDIVTSNGVIHVIDKIQIPEIAKDLNEVARSLSNVENFSTFADMVGLSDTLRSFDKPYTVFAPTDEAFAEFATGQLETLLDQPETLRKLLDYHVVEGKITTTDIVSDTSLDTFLVVKTPLGEDEKAAVRMTVGPRQTYAVNDGQIVGADYRAGNGVLHVINKVLLPPEQTLLDRIRLNSTLKVFLSVLDVSGLSDLLGLPGNYTIFAPTDEAFDALETSFLESLFLNPLKLNDVLQYHLLPRTVFGFNMQPKLHYRFSTKQGETLKLQRLTDHTLTVGNGSAVLEDMLASNGNLFIIDAVLRCKCSDYDDLNSNGDFSLY